MSLYLFVIFETGLIALAVVVAVTAFIAATHPDSQGAEAGTHESSQN